VNLRGRKASLPPADHARPEYMSSDGLVVHHYNRNGRVKDYDFSTLPVAEPLQRSLATLFVDRCVPHIWGLHSSSENNWMHLEQFAAFLSQQDHRPEDLDGLTVALVKRWRQASNHRKFTMVAGLLLRDARLQTGLVADELSRRTARPKSTVQSFSEADFDRITSAAKRTFRAALSRIDDNARHLRRWRGGEFARDSDHWVLGEGLDILARTGSLLYYKGKEKGGNSYLVAKYRRAFGGANAAVTWQRLFLSRMEAAALGVLLLAQYGWNLSVIDRAEVPRALPDPGEDGQPTYRIPLEKLRRGAGHHYETRNVTDDGAGSQGRLITQALHATRFARAIVEDLAPGTDRLIVWRTGRLDDGSADQDRHPPVGRFRFGVHKDTAQDWARAEGFAGSPFQRGRRTVIALDRREPGQHSQDTHDRHYALVDKRVQEDAVEVIAAGANDAATRARLVVLVAELRDQPTPGDVETATADCGDVGNSPWPAPDGGCGASFLACLGCPNARVHPGHHASLAHLHEALTNLRSVLPPDTWEADWGDPHARLNDLKAKLGAGQWALALDRVTDDDRTLINDLLTGALDT
jgi:hypothetical protein